MNLKTSIETSSLTVIKQFIEPVMRKIKTFSPFAEIRTAL